MLRIIAADNQPVALKGLTEIMREGFPGSIVDETCSGREAVCRIENGAYDLAVIDMSLADLGGLEVLKQIRRKKPALPVLMLSGFPEQQHAMRVMKAGGNGYLSKESTSEELVQAARGILSGKRPIDPVGIEKLALGSAWDGEELPHERLSGRELQVARMIGQGKGIRQINEELGLSINTIRTYRARILRKIGVQGTSELIHYAVKNGLTG